MHTVTTSNKKPLGGFLRGSGIFRRDTDTNDDIIPSVMIRKFMIKWSAIDICKKICFAQKNKSWKKNVCKNYYKNDFYGSSIDEELESVHYIFWTVLSWKFEDFLAMCHFRNLNCLKDFIMS